MMGDDIYQPESRRGGGGLLKPINGPAMTASDIAFPLNICCCNRRYPLYNPAAGMPPAPEEPSR